MLWGIGARGFSFLYTLWLVTLRGERNKFIDDQLLDEARQLRPIHYFIDYFFIMDEFALSLNNKVKDMLLPIRLINYNTSYKLEVEIDGTKYLFESDE